MNRIRIALGVIACMAVWMLGHGLAMGRSPVLDATLVSLVGAMLGAFIAGQNFFAPALAVWAAMWGAALWTLWLAAAPTGQAAWSSLLLHHMSAIAASALATLAGVVAGHALSYRCHARARPAAST